MVIRRDWPISSPHSSIVLLLHLSHVCIHNVCRDVEIELWRNDIGHVSREQRDCLCHVLAIGAEIA